MKFSSLEDLIDYILNKVMTNDYERYLEMSFGDKEILLFVFENRIPIKISYEKVYIENNQTNKLQLEKQIVAEVYAELLRANIGRVWLAELDKICTILEENNHIFEKLLKQI